MRNYEILKECKIIHEYINDVLINSKQKISSEESQAIEQTLNVFSKIYTDTYNVMEKEEHEQLQINCPCPHCNNNVSISDLIDYAYVCDDCDENFYLGEGDLGFEWYFEKYEPVRLNDDFELQLSFDSKEGNIIIGTESSSGAEYDCKTIKDLRDAVESYAYNYLDIEKETEYTIEIWETEEDRDRGESFIYLESFTSLKDAISKARSIYEDNNYACVEVINDDRKNFYNRDNDSEDFYINCQHISKVNNEIVSKYIDNWTEHKKLPLDNDLLYCSKDNIYIGIDNTTNDCWTEVFNSEKEVIDWLLGLEIEEKKVEDDELLR